MFHESESHTTFDAVSLDFCGPGDIPYYCGSCKIIMCLDLMTRFRLGEFSGLKEITSEQVAKWAFVKLFVPFGLPKMIFMDADGIFLGFPIKRFRRS